jgi:hypothetical protein
MAANLDSQCIIESGPGASAGAAELGRRLQAATGLQQLLAFRHDCTIVTLDAKFPIATPMYWSNSFALGPRGQPP